jgi:hypothetical protein
MGGGVNQNGKMMRVFCVWPRILGLHSDYD